MEDTANKKPSKEGKEQIRGERLGKGIWRGGWGGRKRKKEKGCRGVQERIRVCGG